MLIYYNPECSKCQSALDLLHQANCSVEIRNYLTQPPSVEELKELTQRLGCHPADLTRKKEPLFLQNFEGKLASEADWLHMLAANPLLIERPILIDGEQAIIGRPPERVLQLVKPHTHGS